MDGFANPVELTGATRSVVGSRVGNSISTASVPNAGFLSILRASGADVSSAQTVSADDKAAQSGNPVDIRNAKVAHDFEVVVLSQFLGDLFSQSTKTLFGDGLQSDVIGSLFTNALAKQLAEKNGLGIAKLIDKS